MVPVLRSSNALDSIAVVTLHHARLAPGWVTVFGHYVVYRLPAIAAILFYWITMKVVQHLTCLNTGCPNGPAYSTGKLLNMP